MSSTRISVVLAQKKGEQKSMGCVYRVHSRLQCCELCYTQPSSKNRRAAWQGGRRRRWHAASISYWQLAPLSAKSGTKLAKGNCEAEPPHAMTFFSLHVWRMNGENTHARSTRMDPPRNPSPRESGLSVYTSLWSFLEGEEERRRVQESSRCWQTFHLRERRRATTTTTTLRSGSLCTKSDWKLRLSVWLECFCNQQINFQKTFLTASREQIRTAHIRGSVFSRKTCSSWQLVNKRGAAGATWSGSSCRALGTSSLTARPLGWQPLRHLIQEAPPLSPSTFVPHQSRLRAVLALTGSPGVALAGGGGHKEAITETCCCWRERADADAFD